MKRFFTKPVLVLVLLSSFLVIPSAYVLQDSVAPPVVQAATLTQADAKKKASFDQCIRTELYFGRNISGGGEVSRKDFNTFLADFVTPRFPDGLTVLNARGQFLNSSGEVEKERTIVLILLYPVSVKKDKHTKIEEIREEYKIRFQQQSVLRVDDPAPVWVSF